MASKTTPNEAGSALSLRRGVIVLAAALLTGAAYLAVTRAEALLLDIARLAGCF